MYAPVSTFALRDAGDHLAGYAAPAAGPAPCLLRLSADGVPIAVARAARFSADARDKAIRLGWCGLKIPGLAMAAAVGTTIQLRCGVSERLLWQRKAHAPVAAPAAVPRAVSVFEIIALSRAEDEASSLAELRPIMTRHLQIEGAASFVAATYETFLGRTAERSAISAFANVPDEAVIDTVLQTVLTSAEYLGNRMRMIPGPFNAAFRYSLRTLDKG